ncbi:MAG TPA: sugar-binding protein [Candidatus Latescibacteria bacterium]|nr:sugar-binding protein [Candidatus Latescibacterota bacterium]
MKRETARRGAVCAIWLSVALTSCTSGPEDLVEDLGHPGRREAARQQLLIAKDRAVEPLLTALAETEVTAARPELAEVLVGLLVRTGDRRIVDDLSRRLGTDRDPAVRSRIARAAGLHRRAEFIEPLLEAGLADADDDVVHQTLIALGLLRGRLGPDQDEALLVAAAGLVGNPHKGVRTEARILAEARVAELVEQGRARSVQAEMAAAESLYQEAVTIVPDNKYANYRLARLRYDRGESTAGLSMLREHGMLLDVPRLTEPPQIDGHLDEELWTGAAHASGFFSFVNQHKAAIPSGVDTDIYVTWDDKALYMGFRGHDEDPAGLKAYILNEDEDLWNDDIVEIYLDADLDHQSYVHMGINSIGVKADAWHPNGLGDQDEEWDADIDIGARVGAAEWTLELALNFDGLHLPKPSPGQVWGFNFVRTHRGSEYSQWVRTFGSGGHSPDDFGFLVFK